MRGQTWRQHLRSGNQRRSQERTVQSEQEEEQTLRHLRWSTGVQEDGGNRTLCCDTEQEMTKRKQPKADPETTQEAICYPQADYQVAYGDGTSAYADIKQVTLDRLGVDDETYRLKFRRERGLRGNTPKIIFFKLNDAADRWLKPS
ncbi:hypothetical protein NDU88_004877 [Pleurodeles waltl]|uniref:Uncharacterized protein n=1 Tax=Pleurodeles waltl TaxID=8319 RepID=A0AAV7MV56_PLEWA|nr:hypothetical protein NDU88_004877 [Pleurodeles waltl]